jgi:hypothetical protein
VSSELNQWAGFNVRVSLSGALVSLIAFGV